MRRPIQLSATRLTMLVILLFASISSQAQQAGPTTKKQSIKEARRVLNRSVLSTDPVYRLGSEYKELTNRQERISSELKKSIVRTREADRLYKKTVDYITPNDRIRLFLGEAQRLSARGIEKKQLHQTLQQRISLKKSAAGGSISGIVSVDGFIPPDFVSVFVFDLHGFLAGEGLVSLGDGSYTVGNLAAGDYYLITESNFVDEFYGGVLKSDFKNWRSASTVSVLDNQAVTSINFDLMAGAIVTGVVTKLPGGLPFAFDFVSFTVFSSTNPTDVVMSKFLFTGLQGEYSLTIPDAGSYKIYAAAPGYHSEFYNNQPDWLNATPVVVSGPTDIVENIDFSLDLGVDDPVEVAGSTINGAVLAANDGSSLFLSLVFAFDTADTSIAGFGISGLVGIFSKKAAGSAATPNYSIVGLDAGSYIVMATDLLSGYSREFYQESATPDGALPVTVTGSDTVNDVDFTLDMSGSISGNVKNGNGDSLPGVLVIALKADLANMDGFFTGLDFGLGATDAQGNYAITGISSGDYFVRTVSNMDSSLDILGTLPSGEGIAGIYLDEWYDNVHSLLGLASATPVSVLYPDNTPGINFQLEKAGVITGKILKADGITPVGDIAAIIAIDTLTYLPQLATFQYSGSGDGSYTLSTLEPGAYKLFAFVDPDSSGMFISEFYDGAMFYAGAMVVDVPLGDTTKNVDFTLEQGGMIRGFVNLEAQLSAGADTLSDFPVVAYEANSGVFAGAGSVSFTGGFRIAGVRPGQYKVAALPVLTPYATTYYGGGDTFDDNDNTVVSVTPGGVQDITINLEKAMGVIHGTVTDGASGVLLNGVMVFSYDGTGHATGVGLTGMDLISGSLTANPGQYVITDLRTGSYYVRTFAMYSLIQSLSAFGLDDAAADPLTLIMGGIGGGLDGLIQPFSADEWFDDIPVELPELSIGTLFGLLQNLSFDDFGFMPFAQLPPALATMVNVTNASVTSNIDFALGTFSLDDLSVSVEDSDPARLPDAFKLGQSYPNPVHRNDLSNGVMINFQLPAMETISISIFNILGQKIASVLDHQFPAGFHEIQWNGKDDYGQVLPSGIYFYALKSETGVRKMKKMVVLK